MLGDDVRTASGPTSTGPWTPGRKAVLLSWIEWPDKATRDEGMKRVMDDPRMGPDNPMPFDGKRMIFGGFAPVVDRRPAWARGRCSRRFAVQHGGRTGHERMKDARSRRRRQAAPASLGGKGMWFIYPFFGIPC